MNTLASGNSSAAAVISSSDERASVDAGAVIVGERDRRHVAIRTERRLQLAEASANECRDRPASMPVLRRRLEHVADRRAGRRLEDAAVGQSRMDGRPRLARRTETREHGIATVTSGASGASGARVRWGGPEGAVQRRHPHPTVTHLSHLSHLACWRRYYP